MGFAACNPSDAFIPVGWGQSAAKPIATWLSQRPRQQDQRRAAQRHQDRQRQSQPPIVAEAVAARPHHQRVVLMADRRQEVARAPSATAIRKASGPIRG